MNAATANQGQNHVAPTLHIFRAGSHRSVNGQVYTLTEADLAAAAAAYDPALHEAPLVVGHPELNGPAYGWVSGLTANGTDLEATPAQVEPAFAELVRAGRFKRVSASFYTPDSPGNPKPGVWYLRHVGFLGAHPPAVKGLRAIEFGAGDEGVVEFGDWADREQASLWRRLREWFIGQFGQETADQVIPGWSVDVIAERIAETAHPAAYAEPPTSQENTVTPEQIAAREAELKRHADELAAKTAAFGEQQTALTTREQQLAAREKAIADAEAARRRADIAAFAEVQVKAGRVLPREQAGLVAVLASLPAETVVSFGEGDAAVKDKPATTWLREFVEQLPARVDFAERAGAAEGAPGQLSDKEIADRARAYRDKVVAGGGSISFGEAVNAVHAGRDQAAA